MAAAWIDAAEAVRLLGVNRATLYAYVSRGFIRSEPVAGKPRQKRYAREDVERLRLRAEERRNPEKAAANAPRVASRDPLAFDFRPRAVAQTGWRILNLLTSVAAATRELAPTIDETLAIAWAPKVKGAADLIRAALILCADHELNVSAFTARCIASAASNPYAAVLGGLAALEGAKHGGATARVEAMFDDLRRSRDLEKALAERLRRGERIDGFGHPLYRAGDPRAKVMFSLLDARFPRSKELAFAHALSAAAQRALGEKPNSDFALVAVSRTLALPPGSPLAIFAIGRTIGWIAHAIEQYAQDAMIRPRARYVGEKPA